MGADNCESFLFEKNGPVTTITNRPGLGVEVDWSLVESLRI